MTTENTNQGNQGAQGGDPGKTQGGAASNAGNTLNQPNNSANSDNSANSGGAAGGNSGSSDNSNANIQDQEQAKPKKEFVDLYNPRNAAELTQEELDAMKGFTKEQLQELARKYPNTGTGKPYLLLYNTKLPVEKQTYAPSTYQNLLGLWKQGLKNFVIFTFASRRQKGQFAKATVAPVQDLTNDEARAELKSAGVKAPTQTALAAKKTVTSVPVGAVQKAEEVPPTKANKEAASGSKRAAGLPGSSTVGPKAAGAKKTASTLKKAIPPKSGNKK